MTTAKQRRAARRAAVQAGISIDQQVALLVRLRLAVEQVKRVRAWIRGEAGRPRTG